MTNEKTKYVEKLEKFVIGEEMKIKRTKGKTVKAKELGVGHLSDNNVVDVKSGKREYSSGTISKMKKDSAYAPEGRKAIVLYHDIKDIMKKATGKDSPSIDDTVEQIVEKVESYQR